MSSSRAGPNAARPHHRPGDREFRPNEPIILDMGCRISGYCGDLTRTLWLGDPKRSVPGYVPAVLRAQDATKEAMRAGVEAREVAAAADRSLQESGFGEYILHSVGHGVGLEIHESPAIRRELDGSTARQRSGDCRARHLCAWMGRHSNRRRRCGQGSRQSDVDHSLEARPRLETNSTGRRLDR